ncbi:MAG: Acyl-CoA dehydrogenase [Candidatus Magnetoglobus multicellularis str. Araruama]|uniref:Acyl-CoA dehydrogenase n=1 Tax=Candidatus Magnetoglobus multicellularis str. Araruama TaxID=890399 RepID=A0A1V1PI81_9BACT|nr:MAG: Acyl-CoA dehydrogenase [Candidatus Magnetoglobus multicellularis str. Araruama]
MNALKNQCKQFANHYSTIETQVFSKEVLQQLSHNGFLGWMIPMSLGGQGKSARQMILAGESLMTHCKNFGITLSWVIHEIVTYWFIHTFGNDYQHKRFIPKLLSGEQVGALAISEPGVGPHPKHLKTQAEISESICLNGEKTYLTNGPIADLFVVIAISHIDAGRKQYSAFIVTNDAPGFHYAAPLDFPFVQTSPHGGIVLNNCIIPKENVLGEINTAYNSMVKPFREIEDTLMMGPILGGMQCQLTYLINDVYNQKNCVN